MYTCIIADDETLFADRLAEYIMSNPRLGFEVCGVFYNGEDAMDYIKTHSVNLIITDIRMDKISGLELSKTASLLDGVEVIIVSAYLSFDYAKTAISYDVDAYLTKPIVFEEFDAALEKVRNKIKQHEKHSQSFLPDYMQVNSDSKNSIKTTKEQIIGNALSYIDKQFTNPDISLQSAAASVYLSPAYFSRIFTEVTGITFSNYLTNKRIEKAVELLGQQVKLEDIAAQVGYSSVKYFCRRFKSCTGLSPLDYYRTKLSDNN